MRAGWARVVVPARPAKLAAGLQVGLCLILPTARALAAPSGAGLEEAMRQAGLSDVRASAVSTGGWYSGRLAGTREGELVLSAGCAGPGGGTDGIDPCGLVLDAVGDLARTPRHRPVRVLLETGSAGRDGAWSEAAGGHGDRPPFAVLRVEAGGSGPAPAGFLHFGFGGEGDGLRITPAWLVSAAVRAGEAVVPSMGSPAGPGSLFFQVAVRLAGARCRSWPSAPPGVPAILFSDLPCPEVESVPARDRAGLEDPGKAWSRWLAATIRVLDGVRGSPPAEPEYLLVGRRLWQRRDLYWGGFLLWVVAVWRGLPGSWRGAGAAERRRRGRRYLPGFAYRTLFLISVLNAPVAATALLAPAMVLGLAAPQTRRSRLVLWGAGLAPGTLFLARLALHLASGDLVLGAPPLLPVLALLATLAAFTWWMLDDACHPPARPGGEVEEGRAETFS